MTSRQRPLRVLHCPTDVGGHPGTLAAAERRLGLDSRLVTLEPAPFGYEGGRSLTTATASIPRREAARGQLLAHALRWADVVHLNFGAGILPTDTAPTPRPTARGVAGAAARAAYRTVRRLVSGRDLALLRACGKVVVVTFQGDDARPTAGHPARLDVDLDQDRRKRVLIAQFDRHASAMFALNPDLLEHLPGRAQFVPYANVDLREVRPMARPRRDHLQIAHAPSNRWVKGTDDVAAAIASARADGVACELDLVEGLGHVTAMTRIAEADLLVDQLRIGWYGGVAVEAMAQGVPVMCHVADESLAAIPADMAAALPVLRTDARTLPDVIRRFAERDATDRAELSATCRQYVERFHDPDAIAERLTAVYADAVGRSRRRHLVIGSGSTPEPSAPRTEGLTRCES